MLVDRGGARGQDGVDVLDHVVRRQPSVAPAEVHRAAGGHEAQADPAGRGDLGAEHVAAVGREHVVVVGGGGAAGAGQPGQAGRGRGADDVLVDAAPHRVKRGQPTE